MLTLPQGIGVVRIRYEDGSHAVLCSNRLDEARTKLGRAIALAVMTQGNVPVVVIREALIDAALAENAA